MTHFKRYENGLKLVVTEMAEMLSVSAGIIVGTGSCNEDEKNNGISHFIEHVTFKGTDKMNAFELSSSFDEIGSQVNAFTSKEMTCYYVKSTVAALKRSFELLSDMFLNSTYKAEELEKEKGVVKEEINMSADTPEEVCLDNLSEAYFGEKGLGRTILGPAKNVSAFGKSDIEEYRKKYYNSDNVVLSFAGKITMAEAEALVDEYFAPFVSDGKSVVKSDESGINVGKIIKKDKDIEQTHIGLAFEGVKFDGEYSDESALLNVVTGSGMSSRLFQKVREELGLCYTVYSFNSGYKSQGTLAVYAGVNPDNADKAADAIFEVLRDIKNGGITDKEFERGKAQILSSFSFAQESTSSQMMLYGKYLLFTGKVLDLREKIKKIETLDETAVNKYLRTVDFGKFSASVYGKNAKKVNI